MTYKLDVTSHLNPRRNLNLVKATFDFLLEQGVSKGQHIAHMQYMKNTIREQDAQPAAWSFGPHRHHWVEARMKRGEFVNHEEIGRALEGEEMEAAA